MKRLSFLMLVAVALLLSATIAATAQQTLPCELVAKVYAFRVVIMPHQGINIDGFTPSTFCSHEERAAVGVRIINALSHALSRQWNIPLRPARGVHILTLRAGATIDGDAKLFDPVPFLGNEAGGIEIGCVAVDADGACTGAGGISVIQSR